MTAYGPAGDPDTTHTVTVVEPPLNPSIRVSQGGGLAPITIDFDGASSGNVQNWSWDFGDGNTAGGEDVSHTYHSAGNYTATLTVSGPAGSAASSVSINVTAQLQAMANASVVSGDAPLTVSFTNQSIGQGVLSFDWDFGDGETSTETAPAHTYQQPCTYTAQLTATDSAPPSISDSTSLVITATAVPLQARIKADRLEGHAPFTLVAEDDSIGSVTGWRWDFGDGTTPFTTADPDLGRDRIYTYTHPGRYLLSLTVSGPLPAPGHQDQAIREVIVRDPNVIPPVARINAVPVIGTSPHTVAFANTSEGTYSSVLWDFGDGTTSTTSSPTHTYGTGGDYFVTLSLLGPPPNRLPITSVSDVIAVDVGPEPGLGPPLSGSSGGVPTPDITRLSPGSGGRRPGGSGTTGMPGSSDAQMGPGWSQASVLRYEPMAGLTFAGQYKLVRPTSAGQYAASIPCGQPCGTELCGLTLNSALPSSENMITLAMVANNSGTAYLAVTEREELTPWPDLTERFATTISTLSVAGALSVTQRVVLDPNAYRTAMAQVFRSGTQYLQSNMSSLIVDDVILLDSGVLVIVGRLRFYFDYGGGSPLGVEELPGLFGISPSNGSLLWSLHGKMYNPEPYEIAEVRANIADDRFLLWVLRSSSGLSSTEIDGELFEGRVPTSGDHLPAREVFSAVNDYKLVDYAVGPDDSIYVVVRDESPLACFDTPLTNYELRIFNKDFTGELAAATPLDLDYDPRFYHHSYGSFGNPRM